MYLRVNLSTSTPDLHEQINADDVETTKLVSMIDKPDSRHVQSNMDTKKDSKRVQIIDEPTSIKKQVTMQAGQHDDTLNKPISTIFKSSIKTNEDKEVVSKPIY